MKCPMCGREEKEIAMETSREKDGDNKAWCPCGWSGTKDKMTGYKEPAKDDDDSDGGDDIEKMGKRKLVEALTTLGVEFDPKLKREYLLELFKAEYAKQNTDQDEEQPE